MNDEENLDLLFLFALIEDGNIESIREYITSGFDVNIQKEEGTTPLLVAAFAGRLEIVKMLVENCNWY